VGSPLFSDWGIEVSSCEGEAGLEGVFDPVRSLAQVDTLVDEGGGVTGSREQVWERLLDRGKYGTGRYVVMMRLSSDRAVYLCHESTSIFMLFDAELCTCSRS